MSARRGAGCVYKDRGASVHVVGDRNLDRKKKAMTRGEIIQLLLALA